MTNEHDQPDSPSAHDPDARIDALARDAGRELRRPAPEAGFARVTRARRNRQITRTAVGSSAVLAIVVGGFVLAGNRSGGDELVPADTVVTTIEPVVTPEPDTTNAPVTTADPDTSDAPVTTADPAIEPDGTEVPVTTSGPVTERPSVVYTAPEPFVSEGSMQTLVDPVDGTVLGTAPVDPDASRVEQERLARAVRSSLDLGDVVVDFSEVRFDSGALPTDLYPDVDLCAQNPVMVTGPNGSAYPERARFVAVAPGDQAVVTLSTTCPEDGVMGADGVGTTIPFDFALQVFDAERPEVPGRELGTVASTESPSALTVSGDGRFVAVETFGESHAYRIFDLETAAEIDLGFDPDCRNAGAEYSRFIGPWVGASSIALRLECPDGTSLLLRDLAAAGGEVQTIVPGSPAAGFVTVEVDHGSYGSPEDAWFTLCDTGAVRCWVGYGAESLVELPDTAVASFIPLGFSPGG